MRTIVIIIVIIIIIINNNYNRNNNNINNNKNMIIIIIRVSTARFQITNVNLSSTMSFFNQSFRLTLQAVFRLAHESIWWCSKSRRLIYLPLQVKTSNLSAVTSQALLTNPSADIVIKYFLSTPLQPHHDERDQFSHFMRAKLSSHSTQEKVIYGWYSWWERISSDCSPKFWCLCPW